MSSANQKSAFRIFNGLAPEEMPKGLPWTYDFSTVGEQSFDLQIENTAGILQMVQSVFVDNSDNPNPLTLKFTITGQRLIVPATAQGLFPVIAPLQTQITATTQAVDGLRVTIILMNVPMPYTLWGPNTINVAPGALTAGAVASAANPAYAPGTSQPLSQTLAGQLRVSLGTPIPAGTNNIGDVDVLSLPSIPAGANNIGSVNLGAPIPAGTNNIGDVDVLSLPALPAGGNNIGSVDIRRNAASFTGTPTTVAGSATAVTLIANNANRIGGSVANASSAALYIGLGFPPTLTNYSYALEPMSSVPAIFEVPQDWRGPVYGIWSSATGSAYCTERT